MQRSSTLFVADSEQPDAACVELFAGLDEQVQNDPSRCVQIPSVTPAIHSRVIPGCDEQQRAKFPTARLPSLGRDGYMYFMSTHSGTGHTKEGGYLGENYTHNTCAKLCRLPAAQVAAVFEAADAVSAAPAVGVVVDSVDGTADPEQA